MYKGGKRMKTWIFDEETLAREIAIWIQKQIETGHPNAVKNATFVGEAIKDFLLGSDKLYQVREKKDDEAGTRVVPVCSDAPSTIKQVEEDKIERQASSKGDVMTIEEMKKHFYGSSD